MIQVLADTKHSTARCRVMRPASGQKNGAPPMKNYKYGPIIRMLSV